MKTHPPGLLALSSSENARYTRCNASIEGIRRPAGSKRYSAFSLSIAANWNHTIQDILLKDPDLEWVFLMNDDHVYPADVLMRLLDHELDAVTALYTERTIPFAPVLYDTVDNEGMLTHLALPGEPVKDPVEIVACGDGAFLVRRHIFELIDAPWWTFGATTQIDRADHDVSFCARLRDAGIRLYADLNNIVGHVTPMEIRPVQQADGSWLASIVDRQGASVDVLTVQALSPEGIL
jgi:hypothetical protein